MIKLEMEPRQHAPLNLHSPVSLRSAAVAAWAFDNERHSNWPVVYLLDDGRDTARRSNKLIDIYVGESLNAVGRMRQHLDTPAKQHLKNIRVILDETFNKSVCLDLESYLIRMLAGDGAYRVLNRNDGIVESNYYQRDIYRERFRDIWHQLARDGVFTRSIPEIENSDLFKLSPFKALTEDQANSVEDIVKGLITNVARGVGSTTVIQGDPGTGKTIVAIYMMKLLIDIKTFTSLEDLDPNSRFAEFFTEDNRTLLQGLRIGLKVFRKTPGLDPSMAMTPFDFDLLVVDETHRLNQRASQPSGVLNAKFVAITRALFGADDTSKTQLDWIRAKSRHQIFLLDAAQSVRPADLPAELLSTLVAQSRATQRYFQLQTQMRIQAGSDFVSYIRGILDPRPGTERPAPRDFGAYDFRAFDDIAAMRAAIFRRDAEAGLARMVAGYAWEWKSKRNAAAFDIEIEATRLRWNSTATDWIASANSLEEVGSIHTVQGYDLNYVGVIVGPDLRYNREQRRLRIYAVLMTRGIRGTYVYACDPGLREYLRNFIPPSS
ncbi:hypothetical protein C8R45DRAFT_1050582 [Mycena sanguinolenta]|nr:hypothetical protein C8R45DRAFT_1050582 [Mycena sanguinolenta]